MNDCHKYYNILLMNSSSQYELEATIDICFNIASFRNLTPFYIRSVFFQIACSAGYMPAIPYLIVSDNPNPSSITLEQYVSPLYSMGPLATVSLSELVVFRLNIPVIDLQMSPLQFKFTFYQLEQDKVEKIMDQIVVDHVSLLWVNSFCPMRSIRSGSAIDLTVQTQILKIRAKNIQQTSNKGLIRIVQQLLLSYNKLKNKVTHKQYSFDSICEQLLGQLEQAKKQSSRRIFESKQDKQKEILVFLAQKYLPEIGDLVLQNWNLYLKQLKGAPVLHQKQEYLTSFGLLVKNNVIHSMNQPPAPHHQNLVIDTMRLKPFSVSLKEVARQEAESIPGATHHIVFLVHGYGATSLTMLPFELILRSTYPHLNVVNSKFNEDKTEDNFQNMGKRLALEVQVSVQGYNFGDDYCISFIAHSMGGLIVRSALTYLEKQRYHCRNLITLATPHLGHLFHNSSLNRFGMWMFTKLQKSEVMQALLLTEVPGNYRASFIYQLSSLSGLDWFDKIVFYGCPQDKFVSLQSALAIGGQEIESKIEEGSERATVWYQMLKNMSMLMKNTSFSKYQVDFSREKTPIKPNFADQWLGRKDHMHFCVSQSFIEVVIANHSMWS